MADQVIIVGAGLTGLVAAHELHRRGMRIVVLEASDHLGGRVATVTFADGAVAEGGMEEFWETSPAYPLLGELGLPLIEQAALSSVVLGGRLHHYRAAGTAAYAAALDGGAGCAGFSAWNDLVTTVLDELAVAQRTGHESAHLAALRRTSFTAFVTRCGLPDCVREWIRIVVESETAVEWDRIAALDGIEEMRPFAARPTHPDGERNVRVAGGNHGVIAALAAGLPEHAVRLGARVRRVHARAGGVDVTYEDAQGRCRVERGHHVVLTLPLWSLAGLDLQPGLDRRARAAVASSAAGSYVKVVLRLRADRVRLWEGDGDHAFPLLTDGPAGCVYLTDGRAEGRDHLVTMLIHGRWARALAGRGHQEIVARAVTALEGVTTGPSGPPVLGGVRAAVTDTRVFDHPNAVAYWPHALGRSRHDDLAAALRAPHGRVLIGGDSTDSSHSDGAVRAGQRMAAHILEHAGHVAAASR